MIQETQTEWLATRESLLHSRDNVAEIHEAIESNLFFERFRSIVNEELNNPEQRLIILYFVNQVIVLPDDSLQILYHNNTFEGFNLLPADQITET